MSEGSSRKADGLTFSSKSQMDGRSSLKRRLQITDRQRSKLDRGSVSDHAAVALVYPDHLRAHHEVALRSELQQAQLEYVLFTIQADGEIARFPPEGWLKGGIAELAILLHRSSIPAWRVVALGDALE